MLYRRQRYVGIFLEEVTANAIDPLFCIDSSDCALVDPQALNMKISSGKTKASCWLVFLAGLIWEVMKQGAKNSIESGCRLRLGLEVPNRQPPLLSAATSYTSLPTLLDVGRLQLCLTPTYRRGASTSL